MLKTICVIGLLHTSCYRDIPDARVIHMPTDLSAEARERERVWERTCLPKVKIDREGISRYTYGPACPNGVIVGK